MTTLMVLALTVPPSLAFVLERWMAGREAQARKLSESQSIHLDHVSARLALLEGSHADATKAHSAELKRLAEQLSILTERYR